MARKKLNSKKEKSKLDLRTDSREKNVSNEQDELETEILPLEYFVNRASHNETSEIDDAIVGDDQDSPSPHLPNDIRHPRQRVVSE